MISLERLKELLSYDPETGIWTWLVSKRYGIEPGSQAGFIGSHHKYWEIQIDGRGYKAHRLAWFYMTGKWPAHEIDHINLDRSDCRWANLREATKSQNQCNIRARSTNTSGFKGVYKAQRGGPWRSQIRAEGRFICLGNFKTKEDAHAAYCAAATKYFGAYARGA